MYRNIKTYFSLVKVEKSQRHTLATALTQLLVPIHRCADDVNGVANSSAVPLNDESAGGPAAVGDEEEGGT